MKRFFAQDRLLVIAGISVLWPVAARVTRHHADAAPSSSSRVTSLNDAWQRYTMPQFHAWAAEARLTREQIAELQPSPSGEGWQAVHHPDDYVVRGTITQEPNDDADRKGMLVMAEIRHLGDTYFPKASSDTTAAVQPASRSTHRRQAEWC